MRTENPAEGQTIAAELLGGWRAPVADWLWLEANVQLEVGDAAATDALLQTVTAVDPRPLYFWINAARIVGCDLAACRLAALGGRALPAGVRRRFETEQARRALGILDRAGRYHPDSPALWIERANLLLNRLGDVSGAAESYRRAALLPGAPPFAARVHAELLRRLGRRREALDWLVKLHPQLAPGDASAGAELVLARIRELERELGVPVGQGYRGL